MLRRLNDSVRAGRQAMERDLAGLPHKQYLSPAALSQFRVTLPLLLAHARGRLIDLGCGDMPFRANVAGQVSAYDSLDLFPRRVDVTFIGDIQHMSMIGDGVYDTGLCIEVLEHVPDPFQAAREIYRILAPGGRLIVSVPHLSRLHDEPHDYYRYTRHGLRRLLEQAGFAVPVIQKRGGFFSFVGHQVSTLVLGLAWSVPVLRQVVWWANRWLVAQPCAWLDARLDAPGLFALGYTAVAVKPAHDPAPRGAA